MAATGLITTLGAKGDSMTATENAQAVLAAPAKVGEAVTKAENAEKALEDALKDANEIAADNDALIDVLEKAIETAKAEVEKATDERDGEPLEDAVAMVEGDDEDEPRSADDIGKDVAMDVGGALMPAEGGARGERAPHIPVLDNIAPPPGDKTAVRMDNHTGKTWAEIVGETSKMRIARTGTTTERGRCCVDRRYDRFCRA